MSKFAALTICVIIALIFASLIGGALFGIFKLCAVETLSVKSVAIAVAVYWFMEMVTDFNREVL